MDDLKLYHLESDTLMESIHVEARSLPDAIRVWGEYLDDKYGEPLPGEDFENDPDFVEMIDDQGVQRMRGN